MVDTKLGKTVFVTVGTTKFEALIRAVDKPEFATALTAKGYQNLIIQKGAGKYCPTNLIAPASSGLQVEYFNFCPSLAGYIASADLIISHAGSGSIFETLTAGKPLIVVPNPLLMDNHQAELGDHLAAMHALVCASPGQLLSAVQQLDTSALRPFAVKDVCSVVNSIDDFMGRHWARG